jgi:hypothetical protein
MTIDFKTSKEDLVNEFDTDDELFNFINKLTDAQLHDISDKINSRVEKCDIIWEVYWATVRDVIEEEARGVRK